MKKLNQCDTWITYGEVRID